MVNQTIYNYIKKNYGRFGINDLKKKVLSKGYSEIEYGEALAIVRSREDSIKTGKRLPFANLNRERSFSWLLIGFISVVLLFFYSLFCFFVLFFNVGDFIFNNGLFVIFLSGVFLFSFFFYLFSFCEVGSLFRNKFLKRISFFLILFYLLLIISISSFGAYLYSYFSSLSSGLTSIPFLTGNAIFSDSLGAGVPFYSEAGIVGSYNSLFASFFVDFISSFPFGLKFFFVLSAILFFGFLICYLLFSVSLFKMRREINFSSFAGVFRFVFVILFLIFCFYILRIFVGVFSDSSYLVSLITNFSSYSLFLLVMIKVLCVLNLISFIFEGIVLFKCYRGFK